MQTHTPLSLTVILAVGLGFATSQALQSSPAEGYPMMAVSKGTNPIASSAGSITTSPFTAFTASSDHDFVVTDVVVSLGTDSRHTCRTRVVLHDGDGNLVGAFQLHTDAARDYSTDPGATSASISHQFSSGLVISPDDTMRISRDSDCGSADYTLSGYHAQR